MYVFILLSLLSRHLPAGCHPALSSRKALTCWLFLGQILSLVRVSFASLHWPFWTHQNFVLGMTLDCIHIFIVTGSFLYWCVMRSASQHFFIHSCIYLWILIVSYLATFPGTDSLSVLMCCKAVNQSTSSELNHFWIQYKVALTMFFIHINQCQCRHPSPPLPFTPTDKPNLNAKLSSWYCWARSSLLARSSVG